MAEPFFKWVGGKRQLLDRIMPLLPSKIEGRYYEPFLGGGAVFFELANRGAIERAHLSDVNREIVNAFRQVRADVEAVVGVLSGLVNSEDEYKRIRALAPTDDVAGAVRFLYLNRCGFNGLYRVNRSGAFNTPWGHGTNSPCLPDRLYEASEALEGVHVTLAVKPFAEAALGAQARDVVYFDPPYAPLSTTANFTSYSADGFGLHQQRELRDVAIALVERGVHVVLSNSNTDVVRDLYAGAFDLIEVSARRAVNSDATKRGKITELLIVPK